jgi:D-alanine transaminase
MNPSVSALAHFQGKIMPLVDVKISALDRGFLFGDAVYEVLRVYAGRPWLEEEHFDRLQRSLEAIRIHGVDLAGLRKRVHETIRATSFAEAIVYIQVTRGAAPRSHAFPSDVMPLELLYVQAFEDPYREARRAGAAVIATPDIRWDRCDIKSTNLLANVLAMQTAKEAGCLEAIYYLPDGSLTEGTHTSLFGLMDGVLVTAPRGHDILPGITRNLVLQLAEKAGLQVREESLKTNRLSELSELFLTGTTTEVLPLIQVDRQKIGEGKPGPVTVQLQDGYRDAVLAFLGANKHDRI